MPDEDVNENTGEADDEQPQAGSDNVDEPTSREDEDAPAGSGDELKRARDDAAKYRRRLRDKEAELEKLKTAGMSDQEKREREQADLAAKVTRLESSNRTLRAEKAATAIGIDPELADAAVALIDWDEIDDPTDQGQVERALKAIVRKRPKLAGQAIGFDGGEGRQRRPTSGDMNDLLRRAVPNRR